MLAELYVVKGREAGKALELSPGAVVSFGRALSNDVRIRDAQVSRVHCRIECTEGALVLRDLSGNGTFVNDERVGREQDVTLADGDVVRLGSTELRVLIEKPDEASGLAQLLARRGAGLRISPSTEEALSETAVDSAREATADEPVLLEPLPGVPGPAVPERARSTLNAEKRTAPRVRARRADELDELREIVAARTGARAVDPDEDPAHEGEPATSSLREVIPGYRIEAKLGGGGRRGTVVYRALQLSLDRPVALKVLLPTGAARERDLGRFLREAAAIARLPHPNVVTIHDAGRAGERRFIVMELLTGGSAADLLEDGPMDPEDALALGIEVAKALSFAHSRGIVHRSVRPGNVLRDAEGTWKLVDFGLSRDVVRGTGGETTFLDAPLETIACLAPEQIADGPGDARSDAWGVGALLYHAWTGRPAFRGDSIGALAAAIARAEVDWEPLEASEAGSALASVLRRCLVADPDARWPDGKTVLHELQAAQAGQPAPPRARMAPRASRPT